MDWQKPHRFRLAWGEGRIVRNISATHVWGFAQDNHKRTDMFTGIQADRLTKTFVGNISIHSRFAKGRECPAIICV
jgi:hypothetical protein